MHTLIALEENRNAFYFFVSFVAKEDLKLDERIELIDLLIDLIGLEPDLNNIILVEDILVSEIGSFESAMALLSLHVVKSLLQIQALYD